MSKSIKKDPISTRNSRRDFLKQSSALAALAAAGPLAGLAPVRAAEKQNDSKNIGIQVGSDSFVDEGIENVLDILQERGAVDTVCLNTFTYDQGIAGRQPSRRLPDHGLAASEERFFHGGHFGTFNPEFYQDTLVPQRAPDHGEIDIISDVLAATKKRGMKLYCSVQDGFNYPDSMPGLNEVKEINMHGEQGEAMCFYHPKVQKFWPALVTDICTTYDNDGILLFIERNGPLLNALGASHHAQIQSSRVTCFCEHHQRAAHEHGINFHRALEGYHKLDQFVQASLQDQRPSDGYYVEIQRLFLEYPEIIAYDKLFDLGKHNILADVYSAAKNVREDVQVGFHIEHVNSFNPFFRATRSYEELADMADFLKVVAYNNAGGERYARFIRNIGSTVFRDVPNEELMRFNNHLLNYSEDEASLDELPKAGLSPNYVFRETQRALAGVKGKALILPGIDVNLPTGQNSRKASPRDTYAATQAAFRAGSDGVILSRKYSEMWLDNLEAAGRAIRETVKG